MNHIYLKNGRGLTLIVYITMLLLSNCKEPDNGLCANTDPIDFNIAGQLVEKFTNNPVKDQSIYLIGTSSIFFIGETTMQELVTDDSGYFATSFTIACPGPYPNYFLVKGNDWRCAQKLNINNTPSVYEIPPMAYLMIKFHPMDTSIVFDSLVVSNDCCCELPAVRLLSYSMNLSDTVFLRPIGGEQTQTLLWDKYKDNVVIGHDSLLVTIPGIDTAEVTINF